MRITKTQLRSYNPPIVRVRYVFDLSFELGPDDRDHFLDVELCNPPAIQLDANGDRTLDRLVIDPTLRERAISAAQFRYGLCS
jgi:hypothetical protein